MIFCIVLQILAFIIIIAEVVIPSAGLLSVVALILLGYSFYIVFTTISFNFGIFLIFVDIIISPIIIIAGLKILSKSRVTLHKTLSKEQGVVAQSSELAFNLNAEGKSITDLRPSGIALINGSRVDVVTRGEYIEANENIIVHDVCANQVIVRKKN